MRDKRSQHKTEPRSGDAGEPDRLESPSEISVVSNQDPDTRWHTSSSTRFNAPAVMRTTASHPGTNTPASENQLKRGSRTEVFPDRVLVVPDREGIRPHNPNEQPATLDYPAKIPTTPIFKTLPRDLDPPGGVPSRVGSNYSEEFGGRGMRDDVKAVPIKHSPCLPLLQHFDCLCIQGRGIFLSTGKRSDTTVGRARTAQSNDTQSDPDQERSGRLSGHSSRESNGWRGVLHTCP